MDPAAGLLTVPGSNLRDQEGQKDARLLVDSEFELSSGRSVRISSVPEYYPRNGDSSLSLDFRPVLCRRHEDEDDDDRLMYQPDTENDCDTFQKSVPKITSIFDSIEEWKLDALSRSFDGLSEANRSVLDASWKGELNSLEEALKGAKAIQIKGRVNCKDGEGRTPLMLASAFGNSQVVQFLIQKGAEVNAWDNGRRATPLACAAACGSSLTVAILIAHGAVVDAADENKKTPIFWAVESGSVSCVRKLLEAGANPNGNVTGVRTPLHAASKLSDEDALPIMEILIEFQADVACREETAQRTPLHIAVDEGNIECIELLLRTGSPRDAVDNRGWTPLHMAANNCDYEALEILLSHKVNVIARDNDGRTPLHRVVAKDARATECLITLLENGAEVDSQDCFGHTPLHLAVLSDSAQIAGILLKYGADITKRTKAGKDCLSLIVRKMPHVIRYIKESLDNAVTIQSPDPNDPQCVLKLDFRPIISNVHSAREPSIRERSNEGREDYMHRETEFISCLIQTGHKSLLSHPLIEAFIVLKWARVRRFFIASIAFHTVMVLLYTIFVLLVYVNYCPYNSKTIADKIFGPDAHDFEIDRHNFCNPSLVNSNSTVPAEGLVVVCDIGDRLHVKVIWLCLILITIFIWLKEIFQMVQEFRRYVKQGEHWVQWILLITVFMAIWPVPMANECLEYWHYPSAAIGIFIAWCLMLVRVGKFPLLGVYIQMLGKVIKNFGVFITAYFCLLVAFTLTFCILFPNEPTFANPGQAFISVIVMLAGELSYEELFYKDMNDMPKSMKSFMQLQYPVTSQIMFGCFVLVISIILMNLLVGLAVSDIQSLREVAKLDRLSRQTNSISQLESFLFSRGLHAFLPSKLGTLLRKSALLVPASYQWTFYFRPHDPRDNRLPEDLQQDALRLATSKQFRRKPSNLVRKRTAQGSKWLSKISNSPAKDIDMLQRNEERILNVIRKEVANGFARISQKVDELVFEGPNKE